jgi:hypothetical protein
MVRRRFDLRLREIHEILSSLLEETRGTAEPAQSHWELPVLPPPDPDGRLSSTDLLGWWFRAPLAGKGNPWDAYFSAAAADPEPHPRDAGGGAAAALSPAADPGREQPPFPAAQDAWTSIASLFPEPEEQLAEEHAQAAVDCLYDFIHAFGRRDVDAAMAQVSESYHTLDHDVEVDRLKFRHQLEAGIDSLTGSEIEISLAEAPEPVSHPHGILIAATVQIDTYRPEDDSHGCLVQRRVAVLGQETGGDWKIQALSLVEP